VATCERADRFPGLTSPARDSSLPARPLPAFVTRHHYRSRRAVEWRSAGVCHESRGAGRGPRAGRARDARPGTRWRWRAWRRAFGRRTRRWAFRRTRVSPRRAPWPRWTRRLLARRTFLGTGDARPVKRAADHHLCRLRQRESVDQIAVAGINASISSGCGATRRRRQWKHATARCRLLSAISDNPK